MKTVRYWSLKKGQSFRLEGWDSELTKFDFCDFEIAGLLFGILPWQKVQIETPSPKLLVELGSGNVALVTDEDEAQALVLNECFNSDEPVFGNWRPATDKEVEELSKS